MRATTDPSTTTTTRRRLNRTGTLLGVVAAAAVVSVAAAGTASAASPYIGSNSGGANVRSCPNKDTCGALVYLPNGTSVQMLCYTDAQNVMPPDSDYTSARWFRVNGGGQTGYVHSSLVEDQIPVGACG